MTAYVSIPNGDVDPESPITTSLMTALRDNPTAITEGSSGAPKITDSAFNYAAIHGDKLISASVRALQLDAASVHTSELNTSTASTSTTTVTNFTLTGGQYVFAPTFKVSAGTGYIYATSSAAAANTSSTSYVTANSIAASGGNTVYAEWRYVAASPPHDMGDGDIPLFLYVLLDNGGNIVATAFADDPVWLANGPTKAYPTHKAQDGRLIRLEKAVTPEIALLSPAEKIIAMREIKPVVVEITEELKHRDKDIIPHPWHQMDLTSMGLTAALLDPVSQTVRDLSELWHAGDDIDAIIYSKKITIGNTPINRVTPAGLLIPETTWKKTK